MYTITSCLVIYFSMGMLTAYRQMPPPAVQAMQTLQSSKQSSTTDDSLKDANTFAAHKFGNLGIASVKDFKNGKLNDIAKKIFGRKKDTDGSKKVQLDGVLSDSTPKKGGSLLHIFLPITININGQRSGKDTGYSY